MKRNTAFVVFTAVLLIVACVISYFLMHGVNFLTDKQNNDDDKFRVVQTQTATPETGFFEDSEEGDSNNVVYIPQNGQDVAYYPGRFAMMDTGDKTNVGHIGYTRTRILPEGATADNTSYEDCELLVDFYKKINQSFPVIGARDVSGNYQALYTGHRIYSRLNISSAETANHDNSRNWRYIKNGYDYLELNAYDTIPKDEGYLLREENSADRIRLFDTQEELDAANDAWNKGQAILNGQADEIQNGIILDGCLLDGVSWRIDSSYGQKGVYVPLRNIAERFSDGTFVTTTGVLHIPIYEGFGDSSVEIPSRKSCGFDAEVQALNIDAENKTWHYNAWNDGGLWEDDFPLTTDSFNMPAEWASRLTGWTFYFDGVMLNIVTEPSNVNNNFILRQ